LTKFVCLASGKGGTGKTTTTLNLGLALSEYRDVTVIDGNLSTPNIALHLGIQNLPSYLNHVLQGKKKIVQSIYTHKKLKVIPSSIFIKDIRKTPYKKLKTEIRKLKDLTDIVLIDSSAGLSDEVVACMKASDELLIVTNPDLPSVTDSLKSVKLAEELKLPITGVIVNKTANKHDLSKNDIEKILENKIIGEIPEDSNVPSSIKLANPVIHSFPYSESAKAYKRLAAELTGTEYEEESIVTKILNFFGL
tara:strand:- start:4508 stop:5257 length:750 start_codon:yes stop_codon:yes gene_type:complete